MLDLGFAIAHHLLVFGLFGVLCAELAAVRRGMTPKLVRTVATIDLSYGVLAGLILIVGFARAHFAAKGWGYYAHNAFFWSKITTFAVIGLLSGPPTIAYIRWKRAGLTPSDSQIAGARRFLYAELLLFAPLLAFAAAMARGYGELGG